MPLSTSFERYRVLKDLRFRIGPKCGEWNTAIVIPIRPFEEDKITLHSRKNPFHGRTSCTLRSTR